MEVKPELASFRNFAVNLCRPPPSLKLRLTSIAAGAATTPLVHTD